MIDEFKSGLRMEKYRSCYFSLLPNIYDTDMKLGDALSIHLEWLDLRCFFHGFSYKDFTIFIGPEGIEVNENGHHNISLTAVEKNRKDNKHLWIT